MAQAHVTPSLPPHEASLYLSAAGPECLYAGVLQTVFKFCDIERRQKLPNHMQGVAASSDGGEEVDEWKGDRNWPETN